MFEVESIFVLLFTLLIILLYCLYALGIYFVAKVFAIIIFGQIILHLILNLFTKPKDLRGKKILITGAASGIGRLLASKCAQQGAHVILWDIRTKALKEAADDLIKQNFKVNYYKCDVANREEVYSTAQKVKNDLKSIDILISNAGIVIGRKILDSKDEEIERVLAVNLNAQFWMTKAFLNDMLKQNSGHIVTIASVAGIVGSNHLVEYCASKFGAFGFAEALRRELIGTNLKTTLVCPWMIDTGMFSGVAKLFLPLLKAEPTADAILEAIRYEQEQLILPKILYILPLTRLMPVKLVDLVSVVTGTTRSMDNFQGRGEKWLFGGE